MSEKFDLSEMIEQAQKAPVTDEALRMAVRMMDLTSLSEDDSVASIEKLCSDAQTPAGPVTAVCVYPRFVDTAARALEKSIVRIATVINFPDGEEDVRTIERSTADAINAGAQEIDVVLDYNAFLSGKIDHARDKLKACRNACPPGVKMKVILESGTFSSEQKLHEACLLSMEQGADFLKTSTGKIPAGASLTDAAVILRAIRHFSIRTGWHHKVGFKVSGGVRTAEDAIAYQALAGAIMGDGWVTPETFRIGASSLLQTLLTELGLIESDHEKKEGEEKHENGY